MAEQTFTLKELFEEIITIGVEKRDFLNRKLEKGKISVEFASLESFRLERLKALAEYLKGRLREENPEISSAVTPTPAEINPYPIEAADSEAIDQPISLTVAKITEIPPTIEDIGFDD